jgi:hypothetical protein
MRDSLGGTGTKTFAKFRVAKNGAFTVGMILRINSASIIGLVVGGEVGVSKLMNDQCD